MNANDRIVKTSTPQASYNLCPSLRAFGRISHSTSSKVYPPHNGYTVILVVVDRLTKYGHFIPLKHPYTAASIASVFIKEIFRLHGMPKSIVSDRDPTFLSTFWQEFFKLQGTKLCHTTAYHPQSDGQSEVLNRTLEHFLRCFSADKPHNWTTLLPWAEWWYNTTFHSVIRMSPFEALYGIPPPSIQSYLPGTTAVHSVDQALRDRDHLLRLLRANLQLAQNRMKQVYDKGRTERTFVVGDWVYLKLQPYRQQSVVPSTLLTNWRQNISVPSKYRSESAPLLTSWLYHLSPKSITSSMYPCSRRRKATTPATTPSLPPVDASGTFEWQPEAILERGLFKQKHACCHQVVDQVGYTPSLRKPPGRSSTTSSLVSLTFRPKDRFRLQGGELLGLIQWA